jgi:uncharacterized SAM-binding protein YcdF (DUF218 family)
MTECFEMVFETLRSVTCGPHKCSVQALALLWHVIAIQRLPARLQGAMSGHEELRSEQPWPNSEASFLLSRELSYPACKYLFWRTWCRAVSFVMRLQAYAHRKQVPARFLWGYTSSTTTEENTTTSVKAARTRHMPGAAPAPS